MRKMALLLLSIGSFSAWAVTNVSLSGVVQTGAGTPIENAVVELKYGEGILSYVRTLSDAQGNFTLTVAGAPDFTAIPHLSETPVLGNWSFEVPSSMLVRITAMDVKGQVRARESLQATTGVNRLENPRAMLNGLGQGVYVIFAEYNSHRVLLGTLLYQGGTASEMSLVSSHRSTNVARKVSTVAQFLVVRKAGYLSDSLIPTAAVQNVGIIVLTRDPLEDRIDSVLALMSLKDKVTQMTEPLVDAGYSYNGSLYGSVLEGGGAYSSTFLSSTNNKVNSWAGSAKIPVTYGKDCVHGAGDVTNATIFPHNIGLGATRDSALVRRVGEVVAQEMWAAGIDLDFAPAISVPQDEHWGRTYEGFGETSELAVMMGAAMVRGLQGNHYDAPWRVIATAKHYLADGGTDGGVDRGNATLTDAELRKTHLPGYEAVVEQGVLSVMVSFNQINGVHQHVDSTRITGWLKTELGFDGYVISDWNGIGSSNYPGNWGDDYTNNPSSNWLSKDAVRKAINAGVDLAMEPNQSDDFISWLTALVNEGSVTKARVDDAVRRILRAKFRAGRMDNVAGPSAYMRVTSLIGSAANRTVAREAVRKSLVLLKNESSTLPLSKTASIYVFGSHADNSGLQSGGWTQGWQGVTYDITGATTIYDGIQKVAPNATYVTSASAANIIIYVTGEQPYAEYKGDNSNPAISTLSSLATYRSAGKKVVTILISGRPMIATNLINDSDAFIAAWLPGSEGEGVADVLFGDYAPTGKLPHTWPSTLSQIPINVGDGETGLYPYGYGLTY